MSEGTHDTTGSSARDGTQGSKAVTVQVTPHTKVDAKGSSLADKMKGAARRAAELAGRAANEGGKAATRAAEGSAEIGASSQRALAKINEHAGKAAKASVDTVGQLTSEAAKATAAGARATWRFTLVTLQWVVWTILAFLLAGFVVGASSALSVANGPVVQFWTGLALLGTAVALHFPPLFFRLPRGWKRLPYMALLPALIGGLACYALVIQTFDEPAASPIDGQSQAAQVGLGEQTEALNTPAPVPTAPTRPSDLSIEEAAAKYGTGNDFNVGRYCLDEEAAGGMTFDTCIGVAAVTLGGR